MHVNKSKIINIQENKEWIIKVWTFINESDFKYISSDSEKQTKQSKEFKKDCDFTNSCRN